jgi:hypothetical protein
LKDFGYNPHITLYDGESRGFATTLRDRLAALNLEFSFVARGPTVLVSIQGQRTFEFTLSFDSEFVSQFLERPITDVTRLTESERLDAIERLARNLPQLSAASSVAQVIPA